MKCEFQTKDDNFSSWKCSITYGNISSQHIGNSWEVLLHVAYSPDLIHSGYHLFASMGHNLLSSAFICMKTLKKWFMNGSCQKGKIFTDMFFINYLKDGENAWNGGYHSTKFNMFSFYFQIHISNLYSW